MRYLIPKALLLVLTIPVRAYAQCLNADDFACFANRFAQGLTAANCDGSTAPPVLNANDFVCFANLFAQGDPRADCDGSCGGWTDLTPPPGAIVVYVAADGSDANPGTIQAPFATFARGYSALRDGHPDQVLFRCGDTWNLTDQITLNKSANSTSQRLVIGSYGTGPRPRFIFGTVDPGFYGAGTVDRHGMAIVGLEIAPSVHVSGRGGITLLDHWNEVLVEDCYIHDWPVNIVVQETSPAGRQQNFRLRRSVITDSYETGGGHSQGLFMGSCDGWVVEGNVFDFNARNKADMFCHNVYIHETCGPGVFNDNITTRACSHGVQQRPGGDMVNNFAAQNPIDLFLGNGSGVANTCRYNVVIDSRDINAVDTRGMGYAIYGDTAIEFNVAGYQTLGTGWGAVYAFDLIGQVRGLRGNAVWAWNSAGTHADGAGYVFESGTIFTAPSSGNKVGGTQFSYYGTPPAGDWLITVPTNPHGDISDYMNFIGQPGGLFEFVMAARQQSKQTWNTRFTSDAINDFIRQRFGIPPN